MDITLNVVQGGTGILYYRMVEEVPDGRRRYPTREQEVSRGIMVVSDRMLPTSSDD